MADDEVQVRLLWIDLDETPVYAANQFIGQFHGQEIIVAFGHMSPPVIVGETLEERRGQAEGLGYVPVRPVARISLTRENLGSLMNILEQTKRNYEAQHGGGE